MYIYTLPQTVENSARRFPDKAAFHFMGEVVTYAQLETQMNQLANLLIELGVKKGDRVGIFMSRSLETAVAMYGIMAAGAVYVPINPAQPVARTHFVLKNCGIKHLITNGGQRRTLPQIITKEVELETVIGSPIELEAKTIAWEVIELMSSKKPNITILENDLAYLLYTSGSTGTPKGIMHTHRSGLAYAKLSAAAYDLTSDDILGNHAPIYFDISTLGYFAVPLVGATTVIASEAHIKMPASLSQLIEKEKITVWYSVPLALIQMLQRGALDQRDVQSLRWVIFAGELFPTKHLRELMQQWSSAKFSNAYGPTETNVCTYYNVENFPKGDDPISIGKPWGNTEIMILNENNLSVNDGEVGELLVRSATLMEGYWARPDLNEKSFFQIERQPGVLHTYYRTGDLVRKERDSNLTFLGRKDRQVKTRGFRVELDEITNAFLKNEAIEEAAVYTVSDEDSQTLIEAAIILKNNEVVEEKDILQFLKNHLSWYAIPHKIHMMNEFPRTATGKIDLKELQGAAQTVT